MKSHKVSFYIVGLAFAFLAMTTCMMFTDSVSAATSRVALIEEVEGDVTARKAGGSKSFIAYRNMHLNEGDHLITGPDSRVVLRVLDVEDEMIVGENSKLYIGDLKEEAGKKKSKIKMWFGSLWAKVNPFSDDDSELEVETPTSVMGVRGTHFVVNIDPVTGDTTLSVLDGIVSSRDNNENQENNEQERLIYPGQQVSIFPGQDGESSDTEFIETFIDVDKIVENLDESIIENLLRHKQEIDQENEEWLQQLLEQLNNGLPTDFGGIGNRDDLERYRANLERLIDVLISNAVHSGKIDQESIEDIVDRINEETNQEVELDLDQDELDLTDQQQRELERLRAMERRRQEQLERERKRREEMQERNENLLDQLEDQRRRQEEQNRQAEEERKRRAQEDLLDRLSEEQRKQLEDRMQQREEERRDRSQPSERPQRPVYTGGGSGGDDSEDTPSNSPPTGVSDTDQSLNVNEILTITPDDLAVDEDGDELSFVSASSADEAIVTVQLEESNLKFNALGEGTVEVTAEITDGKDSVVINFVVTVIADTPENNAPVAKDDLDQTLAPQGRLTILPADLSIDEDGDELSFVDISATSSDEEVALAHLDGQELYLEAISPGSAEVSVEITDGTDMVKINFLVNVISPEKNFFGMIDIPEPAPTGGIPVTVYATDPLESDFSLAPFTEVVIPEGQTEVFYFIEIPDDKLGDIFYFSYEIDESFTGHPYVPWGILGEEDQWGEFTPFETSLEENQGNYINFHLIQGHAISGNVNIPHAAPAGGEEVYIAASREYQTISESRVIIPEGEKTVPYTLIVPPGKHYKVGFDYIDYDIDQIDYFNPMYYYLNLGPSPKPEDFPAYWKENEQVAIEGEYMATPLDVTLRDQTGINLNFPSDIPEYQIIAKNDMFFFISDPNNEKDYSFTYLMLDGEYVNYGDLTNTVVTDLNPGETYDWRFIGSVENQFIEGDIPTSDIKETVVTTAEPNLNGVRVMPLTNSMDLYWDIYSSANEYRVFLYEKGSTLDNQFTEPYEVIQQFQGNQIHTTINNLKNNTEYVVRVEAMDGSHLLAGTTLSTGTISELGAVVDPANGRLSWDECSLYGGCNYQAVVMDQSGITFTYNVKSSEGRNVAMDGLTPNTYYEVTLIAYATDDDQFSNPRQGIKLNFNSGEAPVGSPQLQFQFNDADPDEGELEMNASKFPLHGEYWNNVTNLDFYWANQASQKIGEEPLMILDVEPEMAEGAGNSHAMYGWLASNTEIPEDAVKFLIYASNAYGQSEDHLVYEFQDYIEEQQQQP